MTETIKPNVRLRDFDFSEGVHFDTEIPGCEIKSLMSKKFKWRKDWAYCYSLEKLMAQECVGFTLNMCCGFSNFGDIRADLDPQTRPTVVCDMRYPPFRDGAFDSVFMDPFYGHFNRPGFLIRYFDLAKRRVIIDSLPIDWKPSKNWRRKWVVLTRRGLGMLIKTGAVYIKKDGRLEDSEKEFTPEEDLDEATVVPHEPEAKA